MSVYACASMRVCVRVGLLYACMIIIIILLYMRAPCVRMFAGTCVRTCVYVPKCTYMRVNVYAYVCAATCAYACAYASARVRGCAYPRMWA